MRITGNAWEDNPERSGRVNGKGRYNSRPFLKLKFMKHEIRNRNGVISLITITDNLYYLTDYVSCGVTTKGADVVAVDPLGGPMFSVGDDISIYVGSNYKIIIKSMISVVGGFVFQSVISGPNDREIIVGNLRLEYKTPGNITVRLLPLHGINGTPVSFDHIDTICRVLQEYKEMALKDLPNHR